MVNNLKEALLITYNTRDEKIKKSYSFEEYSKLVLINFLKKGNQRAFTRTDGAKEYALSHNLYDEMENFIDENGEEKEFGNNSQPDLINNYCYWLGEKVKFERECVNKNIMNKLDTIISKYDLTQRMRIINFIITGDYKIDNLTKEEALIAVVENAYRLYRNTERYSTYGNRDLFVAYGDDNYKIQKTQELTKNTSNLFTGVNSSNLQNFIVNLDDNDYQLLSEIFVSSRASFKNVQRIASSDTLAPTGESMDMFSALSNPNLKRMIAIGLNNGPIY